MSPVESADLVGGLDVAASGPLVRDDAVAAVAPDDSAVPIDAGPAVEGEVIGELGAAPTPVAGPVDAVAVPAPTPEAAAILPPVDVTDLDWMAIGATTSPARVRAALRDTVERLETQLDRAGGPGLMFDDCRTDPSDRAIAIPWLATDRPLWFIGDLHGDLLALEAALALARQSAGDEQPRLVFLGDLFDDGAYGLEVLLRVFSLIVDSPASVCVIAGNHDEALHYDGARFSSTVSPSDFSEFLNANLAHEWMARAGKLAVRLFETAPRALFFPDGLLAAHGGFPLTDLHAALRATGDWNAPACLSDFVWVRAHPKARRKLPNRVSRGSQFGYEDFDAFCDLGAELGRPVTHMVRGHDHVEARYAIFPAYRRHPMLTTVALSRRLPRESFGPDVRVPTVARWVPGALPEVYRLHIPAALVRACYPEAAGDPVDDVERIAPDGGDAAGGAAAAQK